MKQKNKRNAVNSTFLPFLTNAADRNRTGTGITTHGILSPGRLKLWKYEADLYETYLSEVELSDRRMKKLEQVSVQELQEIREAMYKKRRSAYQESMMEALRK